MIQGSTPKYLCSFDFDGTLSTDLRNARTLQQRHPDTHLLVNTGRTNQDLYPIANYVKGLQIKAISTGNGESYFINHKNMDGDAFCRSIALGEASQEPKWKEHLMRTDGWDHDTAVRIIQRHVQDNGLAPGYGDTDFHAPEQAGRDVVQLLGKHNIQAQVATEEGGYLQKIGPKSSNKASVIDFAVKHLNGIKGVVAAGDSDNDIPQLALKQVQNAQGEAVPVVQVAMGHDDSFVRQVQQMHPEPNQVLVATRGGDSLCMAADKQLQNLKRTIITHCV